jgi:hypothetical protein
MEKVTTAEIDRLRDMLAEARHYLRSSVVASADLVDDVLELMGVGRDDTGTLGRLADNLRAGRACMLAAPTVLEGYIDGARWELLMLKGRCNEEDSDEDERETNGSRRRGCLAEQGAGRRGAGRQRAETRADGERGPFPEAAPLPGHGQFAPVGILDRQ